MGTVTAHDRKAASRWRSHETRMRARLSGSDRALTGEALERAVMSLAATHPEYVVHGA